MKYNIATITDYLEDLTGYKTRQLTHAKGEDKRWSNGDLYRKLGFTHIRDSKPNYFYVVNKKRENRFKYRKSELVKQGFDKDKSEHEIMAERKIPRIYDCGMLPVDKIISKNNRK